MSDVAPQAPPPGPLEKPVKLGLSFTPTPVSAVAGVLNSAAIIGGDKSGKTTLGGSASAIPALIAANKKTLILTSETGSASIADDYPLAEQFHLTNKLGFDKAVDELMTRDHSYGVVVIDTYDKFQSYASEWFLANYGSDTRYAYGLLKKWTLETAWKLHKAPFTVIFLFHSETVKDDRNGALSESFKLIGSAGDEIGEVFDLIGFLTVEDDAEGNAQRVLQLGPKVGVKAGNRWEKKLPRKMVNATMAEIISIIRTPNPTTPEIKE